MSFQGVVARNEIRTAKPCSNYYDEITGSVKFHCQSIIIENVQTLNDEKVIPRNFVLIIVSCYDCSICIGDPWICFML